MHGVNGVNAGTKDNINACAGDVVRIPLLSTIDQCSGKSCPRGHNYWITSLGCIEVVDWGHNEKLYYPDDPTNQCWKGHVVKVRVACSACVTACGSTSGTPPIPGGVNAVSLIE